MHYEMIDYHTKKNNKKHKLIQLLQLSDFPIFHIHINKKPWDTGLPAWRSFHRFPLCYPTSTTAWKKVIPSSTSQSLAYVSRGRKVQPVSQLPQKSKTSWSSRVQAPSVSLIVVVSPLIVCHIFAEHWSHFKNASRGLQILLLQRISHQLLHLWCKRVV